MFGKQPFMLSRLLFGLAAVSLMACGGINRSGAHAGGNLIKTFYAGDLGVQYFVKPLRFDDEEATLLADFTYRLNTEIPDTAVINYSVFHKETIQGSDSLGFSHPDGEVVAHPVKLLFKEQKGNWFVSRFSTELPVDELSKIFETSDWSVLNYQNGQVNRYEAGSKTQKALQQVQAQTFSLYDN